MFKHMLYGLLLLLLLPLPSAQAHSPIQCMAEAVYYEARGEGIGGMMAVATVIMERVKSPKFPSTVCQVVKQPKHFSYLWDGKQHLVPDEKSRAWKDAQSVAQAALSGASMVAVTGSTYYHAKGHKPWWTRHARRVATIGQHIFYKDAP